MVSTPSPEPTSSTSTEDKVSSTVEDEPRTKSFNVEHSLDYQDQFVDHHGYESRVI